MTVSCTGCTPACPGAAKRLPTSKSTRMLSLRCCGSKVEPTKAVAELMIRAHLDGILAWVTSRPTNGFPEAVNGLFQTAKRKARGYGRFETIRMVIFMIAGKLNFTRINPYVTA